MTANSVSFKDYVSWTIKDLETLTKSVELPDRDLPKAGSIVKDQDAPSGYKFVFDETASPEQKREAMRNSALPRLDEIYVTNLAHLASVLGGMSQVTNDFFRGLDEVFRADTAKLDNETIQDYLGRKILNPIKKLLSSQFKDNPALLRAQYVFELVEQKASEAQARNG